MKKIIDTEKLPIKLWLDEIEDGALQQAKNLANLPFAFHHIALMPDAHFGFGMPIGGVLSTINAIIPHAVGADAGCGMNYVQTNVPVQSFINEKMNDGNSLLHGIVGNIKRNIPVGFNKHKVPQEWSGFDFAPDVEIIRQELNNARLSLGTMGGNNHFIEIQQDKNGLMAFMLHSGSRNLGKRICDYYDNKAKLIANSMKYKIPNEWQLAYFELDSEEGQEYMKVLNFALEFARANRFLMMERIKNVVFNMLEKYVGIKNINIIENIDIHHNYAILEEHFGEKVMVHRKGAIKQNVDEKGIIPGNMESPSYIVKGKGNIESFISASHGAGRALGRKETCRRFTNQSVIERIKSKGIFLSKASPEDTAAEGKDGYKDIDLVIYNESDLIDVTNRLTQIAVIKG
jgi:tRNA-splicing ligase RtcB